MAVEKYIRVKVKGRTFKFETGCTLEKIAKKVQNLYISTIVAAKLDNSLRELSTTVKEDCEVDFIDLTQEDGIRIYRRSLKFLLIKAMHDLFPEREVQISHSVSKGIYFEVVGGSLKPEEIFLIDKRMRELVMEAKPFEKKVIPIGKAKEIFKQQGREDRFRIIQFREKNHVTFYKFGDLEDYFYGYMVPNSSYLELFKLEFMDGGIILISPLKENPNQLPDKKVPTKLFHVFSEYKNWIKILGVEDVGLLNDIVNKGEISEFIRISEALHEKKIANIADIICKSDSVKIVLIAGPSSSGKTTFAHRLGIQLRVNGVKPVTISLDDYFVDKSRTPIGEDGKPDLEALETVDLKLFNTHLKALINGETIEVPTFNFAAGCREYNGRKLRLEEGEIIVIEGIHGLNPRLTPEIPANIKFKIYVSAITSMRIDHHNRIPTTDLRLIRRIVRDSQFRGCSAAGTLELWPNVRKGEEKNIFPYQEEADIMFNSSLIYELGVLKKKAMPLLREVERYVPQYIEARRLISFLSYFMTIETDEIPPNSILREFIGGSCFYK